MPALWGRVVILVWVLRPVFRLASVAIASGGENEAAEEKADPSERIANEEGGEEGGNYPRQGFVFLLWQNIF